MEIKSGKAVDETMIAERRHQLRYKFFMYRRKKARWVSLYNSIESNIEQPVHFEHEYLKRELNLNVNIFGEDFAQHACMAI